MITPTVNAFVTVTHALALKTPTEWMTTMTEQLKEASRLVYNQKLLPQAYSLCDNFELFWSQCRKSFDKARKVNESMSILLFEICFK